MYGIYATVTLGDIGGILMVNVTIYIPYMDPMGYQPFSTEVPVSRQRFIPRSPLVTVVGEVPSVAEI